MTGKREGAGKKPIDIGEAARAHAAEALHILNNLALNGKSTAARDRAMHELRDRGICESHEGRTAAKGLISPTPAAK